VPEPNPYDKGARFALKQLDAPGMFAWMLPDATPAGGWGFAGWSDTQTPPFPGEPERRCDTLAVFERVEGDAPPVAAVVEVQAVPQTGMLQRLADYCVRVWEEVPYQRGPAVRYDVVCVLLGLTGPRQPEEWLMRPPGFGGAGLAFRIHQVVLSEQDARRTLAGVADGTLARCVLVWVPLMHGGGDPEVAAEWRRLAEQEADARRRLEHGVLALTFAELAGCLAAWEKALEGWNMLESKVVNEWIAIGEKRGEARGEARGKAQGRADALLSLLEFRFGSPLPEEIHRLIAEQTDPGILQQWFTLALPASDLDQWRASLQQP
jgi:hypothetical protein